MTTKRHWYAVLVGMAAIAATIGPVTAQTRWDLYAFTGVTHPITIRYQMFVDEVKKATDGKLLITVRPAGELPFRATEVVKATSQGQVQLAAAYQGFISGEMPIASIASLPFLVRNAEELEKVYPIIEKYTKPAFAERKVRTLFWHTWPEQNIYGRGKPIRSIEDFAGRKIRSTDGKQAEMLKQLGAASVNLTTPEVPVAIERGVADGFMTAAFNVIGAKWFEFTEWAWMGDVNIGGPDYLIMNEAAYNELPDDVRTKLDEVANAFGPKMRAMNIGDEKGAIEELKTKHNVALFTPPKEQIDKLTERMKPYWETWAKAQGEDTVALLKEIRAALDK
ncbi:MAG: TRAP transporter substrate-binding protein DctP [Alphaproteobacteria bacterium]|nr:TRAP transporter substrate-binding protein DctP [Alphaproteobacteria bacterium]